MKRITLKELTLKNFKAHKDLKIEFNPEKTIISGDNDEGKSSIFNAFIWLLSGKDVLDRKDYEIRPIINGELQRRTDCTVEGTFDVDGTVIKLTRTLREKWQKPRGQIEEVFRGNETETKWGKAIVNVSEYQKRVKETFVDNTTFKLLTNPLFFAQTLDWKEQREILIQLAGTPENAEIAGDNPQYQGVIKELESKSFDDFKKEIAQEKRNLKDELKKIDPRIDQTVKLTPEAKDWAKIESEIKAAEKQIEEIDTAITDKAEAYKQQVARLNEITDEIADKKAQQTRLVRDAKEAAENDAHESNKELRHVKQDIKGRQRQLDQLDHMINSIEDDVRENEAFINKVGTMVQVKREEWDRENAKEYKGETTCSCCGQELPADKIEQAKAHFEQHREKRLTEINTEGKALFKKLESLKNTLTELQQKKSEILIDRKDIDVKISQLKAQIAGKLEQGPRPVIKEELEGYKALDIEIEELEEARNNRQDLDTSELKARKAQINNHLQELKTQLKDRDVIKRYKAEVERLTETGRELAQKLSEVEEREFDLNQFNRERIRMTEDRVNQLFDVVTFQLFEYTQDGNESETCIPLVKGVPFPAVNTAGQINAGIDIINALSKFEGVSAPIFLDNTESVSRPRKTDSQLVLIEKVKDQKLTIEN